MKFLNLWRAKRVHPSKEEPKMTKIRHIIASPCGDNSQSSKLANAYLAERKARQPHVQIDVLDLWQEDA